MLMCTLNKFIILSVCGIVTAPSLTFGTDKEPFQESSSSSSQAQSSLLAVPQSISAGDNSDNFRNLYSRYNIPGNAELLDKEMIGFGKTTVAELEREIQALAVDKPRAGISFVDENDYATGAPKNIGEIVSQRAIDFFSSNPSAEWYSGDIKSGKGKLYKFGVNKFEFTHSEQVNQEEVAHLTKQIEQLKCKPKDSRVTKDTKISQESTENDMGNIMYTKNLIITEYEKFVNDLIKEKQMLSHLNLWWQSNPTILWPHNVNVLDIGTATGFNSQFVPEKGGFLVANDVFLNPLLELRSRLTQSELNHTFFNVSSFPDQMIQPMNMFQAVLCSHVIHYQDGPQMRRGFDAVIHWLQEGGKFYIQALSPYSNPFKWRAHTLKNLHLMSQKDPSLEWPGCFYNRKGEIDFEEADPAFKSAHYPNLMHALHPAILERELQRAGFEIEYLNFSSFENNKKLPVSWKDQEYYVTGDWSSQDLRITALEQVMMSHGFESELEGMKNDRVRYLEAKKTKNPFVLKSLANVMVIARKPVHTKSTASTQQ